LGPKDHGTNVCSSEHPRYKCLELQAQQAPTPRTLNTYLDFLNEISASRDTSGVVGLFCGQRDPKREL
jgi:hypothetical protein